LGFLALALLQRVINALLRTGASFFLCVSRILQGTEKWGNGETAEKEEEKETINAHTSRKHAGS